MKLFDNVKVLGNIDYKFCSIVDIIDDKHFLIECWESVDNNVVNDCSLLVVRKDKLKKLTNTEEMEFKRLMDEYYKKNT